MLDLDDAQPRYWILDAEGEPTPVGDVLTWARWFETTANRRVLDHHVGRRVWVSTVFLGLDHNWLPDGPPVLWETMIFGGPFDQFQQRYTSALDALIGHETLYRLAAGYAELPRKTKKALRKFGRTEPQRPGDRRRLARVLARIGMIA